MPGLPPEVKYEPRLALDGGRDGLDFYRRIIQDSPGYLRKGGIISLEIGYNQGSAVRKIIDNSGNYRFLRIVSDYSRLERVVMAERA